MADDENTETWKQRAAEAARREGVLLDQLRAVTAERDRLIAAEMRARPATEAYERLRRIELALPQMEARLTQYMNDAVAAVISSTRTT